MNTTAKSSAGAPTGANPATPAAGSAGPLDGPLDALFAAVLAASLEARALPHADLARVLRDAFPGRHITVCSEDDVSPRLKPVAENDAAAIYLVASGDHCLSFTNDPAAATGLVVALVAED